AGGEDPSGKNDHTGIYIERGRRKTARGCLGKRVDATLEAGDRRPACGRQVAAPRRATHVASSSSTAVLIWFETSSDIPCSDVLSCDQVSPEAALSSSSRFCSSSWRVWNSATC